MPEPKAKRLKTNIPKSKMRMEVKPTGEFGRCPTVWMDYLMGEGTYFGTFRDQRFVIDGKDDLLTITLFDENGRNGVKALLPYLQRFVETGELIDAAELAAPDYESGTRITPRQGDEGDGEARDDNADWPSGNEAQNVQGRCSA